MIESVSEYQDVLPHLSPVWTHGTDIIASRAQGACVYDLTGREYLDFTCGIGVTNTGHCHPLVVEAIREQAGLLLHGQANIILHQPMLELVRALMPIVPPGIDGFFFSNSGAEAVEGAIKLARHATGRSNIIVFQGSFHGRTSSTMALTTSKTIYRAGYQPLPSGVFVAPYPYAYRYGWDDDQTTRWCLDELEFLLMSQTAPQETAAILIEPVLGEGGYVVPPAAFLHGLRQLCDRHGILLIADEIQSGFGRTGKWFSVEHFGLQPDIVTVAKGLGSGLPISGVFSRLELMNRWVPGSHGGTFGGNAVACAAAVATIQAIQNDGMLENAQARGQELMAGLRGLQQRFPRMGDVRGLGLMIGVEFRDENRKPDKPAAKAVAHACLERGLMLLTCGPWDNVIRWIPPLVITPAQAQQALRIFAESLQEVLG
jgi:4-aminobutyrate aminotransferase